MTDCVHVHGGCADCCLAQRLGFLSIADLRVALACAAGFHTPACLEPSGPASLRGICEQCHCHFEVGTANAVKLIGTASGRVLDDLCAFFPSRLGIKVGVFRRDGCDPPTADAEIRARLIDLVRSALREVPR